MDPRITEKVKALKQAEIDKEEAEKLRKIESEKWYKNHVKEQIPAARKFVEKYMLDEIAKETLKGNKEISVPDGWQNPYDHSSSDRLPPVESIVHVLREIEGLTIKSTWVPEYTGHINSDECMETIAAHYTYKITWK